MPKPAFAAAEKGSHYFEQGRKLGSAQDKGGLGKALEKLIDDTVQIKVNTTGKKVITPIGGGMIMPIIDEATRKDVLKITGEENAAQIRQLLAGYLQANSSQGSKDIVDSLITVLEKVIEKKKAEIEYTKSKLSTVQRDISQRIRNIINDIERETGVTEEMGGFVKVSREIKEGRRFERIDKRRIVEREMPKIEALAKRKGFRSVEEMIDSHKSKVAAALEKDGGLEAAKRLEKVLDGTLNELGGVQRKLMDAKLLLGGVKRVHIESDIMEAGAKTLSEELHGPKIRKISPVTAAIIALGAAAAAGALYYATKEDDKKPKEIKWEKKE